MTPKDSAYAQLIRRLGFVADPFAKTNADEEERLDLYFIQPPFYETVLGNPKAPRSTVVFAPRGGGKTALKRKMEIASVASTYLCVTYNSFPVDSKSLNDISLEYHLTNIVRLVLTAVISECSDRGISNLNNDDRHFLYLFASQYFTSIERNTLKESIAAVKNLPDTALEWWNKFTGPIGLAVNVLLSKLGMGSTEVRQFASAQGSLGTYSEQLQLLREIANKLGKSSVYVLVDRVDELPFTGSGSAAYDFVSPLLTNLQLLESRGYAFKFFLWDMLLDGYQKFARPDRVKYHILAWSHSQLRTMLSERLKAYSQGRVSTMAQLLGQPEIDKAIIQYSLGSPRTIIRICKEIVDQQSEINAGADKISPPAVSRGLDVFAKNFAHETVPKNVLRELKRLGQVNFTVKHIYSNVFKFTQQAGIAKVKQWQDDGIVEKVGPIRETTGSKPSNLYGIRHPLVGKCVFADLSPFEFTQKKLRVCSSCDTLLIRDWDIKKEAVCHRCDTEVMAAPEDT